MCCRWFSAADPGGFSGFTSAPTPFRASKPARRKCVAALRRRSKIGDEPAIDEDATAAAIAAHDAVNDARAGERAALDESMRWLAIGNLWGIGSLGVAAALVIRGGVEPMAPPVYAAVITGATGPLATMILGLCRRSIAAMRVTSAITEWSEAVARAGFATMGELHGRRLARAAWARRRDEADAANAVARDARAAWHRVAGPGDHPREAPTLIARMTVLRAAQLELLKALIAERMKPRELHARSDDRELDTAPMAIIDVSDRDAVPFDVVWAEAETT